MRRNQISSPKGIFVEQNKLLVRNWATVTLLMMLVGYGFYSINGAEVQAASPGSTSSDDSRSDAEGAQGNGYASCSDAESDSRSVCVPFSNSHEESSDGSDDELIQAGADLTSSNSRMSQVPIEVMQKFAAELSPKMEKALSSESAAVQLVEELGKCAIGSEHPIPLKALCLNRLEILSQAYPSLKQQVRLLKLQMEPVVILLAE